MITVYQSGELHFLNKIYKCALGKNGINKKKIEGDIVESGIWRGGNLFLSKIIQEKKPVIFVSGHFANFEIMSMEISKKKISLAPWTHETLKYGVSRTRKYIVMVAGGIILFLYQTCTGKLPPIGS